MRIHTATPIRTLLLTVFLVSALAACDFLDPNEIENPNASTVSTVREGATPGELQNLVFGVEDRHRNYTDGTGDITQLFGSFGREVYAFYDSDQRFITNWLGLGGVQPDPSFFADGSAWEVAYAAIKQANLLIEAVSNTDAVTPEEANGYTGYAKTIQGFQYLIPLNGQYRNEDGSIRFDVSDPLNPGPFLGFDEALGRIRTLLDEGNQELGNAALQFVLPAGYGAFATPEGLSQLNRAIAARAAIYAEDWEGALSALDGSFLDLTAGEESMAIGVYHNFGNAPDTPNPLFYVRNSRPTNILAVHPSMLEDALEGDMRVANKFFLRAEPLTTSTLPGVEAAYQDNRYDSPSSPIPFIRNEELVLIYAEANAQLGRTTEAVQAINVIRESWELDAYSGATDLESLIDEILFQRRYSLWAEGGHRWIDARRYGRLDEIPTDLDGGQVFERLVRPLDEINAM